MFMIRFAQLLAILGFASLISACNQSQPDQIQPAVKPSSDASAMAQEAWVLINQLDPIVYQGEQQHLAEIVEKPLRELSTRWRLEVKMTDSVAEGKYALCRKSLVSLQTWARSISEHQDSAAKKAAYERDKALCKDALDHPQFGNSIIQQ